MIFDFEFDGYYSEINLSGDKCLFNCLLPNLLSDPFTGILVVRILEVACGGQGDDVQGDDLDWVFTAEKGRLLRPGPLLAVADGHVLGDVIGGQAAER